MQPYTHPVMLSEVKRSRSIFHRASLFILSFLLALPILAQERKVHLDVSATAGSTGIGGEISVQPHPWVTVRAGGTYMPKINVPRDFVMRIGEVNEYDKYDEKGQLIPAKFDKMADFLEELTGYHTDRYVRMNRRPVMNNAKLLVDVHPLKNKNWHVTAGIYMGGKYFITGENATDEAPLLVSVNIYNNMYQKVLNGENIQMGSKEINLPQSIQDMIRDYGRMSVHMGTFKNDIYDDNGNIIHHSGDKFFVEPDANGQIKARCQVNRVRPYVGIGYMGALSKNSDRWKIGFDAGALFWGGHPTITLTRTEHYTTIDPTTGKGHTTNAYYDIDITRDIDLHNTDIKYGAVRKEVNFIKALKVYPVLEIKLCYCLF